MVQKITLKYSSKIATNLIYQVPINQKHFQVDKRKKVSEKMSQYTFFF